MPELVPPFTTNWASESLGCWQDIVVSPNAFAKSIVFSDDSNSCEVDVSSIPLIVKSVNGFENAVAPPSVVMVNVLESSPVPSAPALAFSYLAFNVYSVLAVNDE